MKKPKIERILTVGTVAVIFIAWILASTVGGVKELFIPSPIVSDKIISTIKNIKSAVAH